MWRYLLDENAFVIFQRAGKLRELTAAAAAVPMAIVEEVYDELLSPRGNTPRSKRQEVAAALQGSAVKIHCILLGSPEAAVRAELLKEKVNDRGRGEAASIALAAHDAGLILVTEDWGAVRKSYRELHGDSGRAIRLHSFIRLMVERGALTRESATVAATAAEQESNIDPPLWWAAWVERSSDPLANASCV